MGECYEKDGDKLCRRGTKFETDGTIDKFDEGNSDSVENSNSDMSD